MMNFNQMETTVDLVLNKLMNFEAPDIQELKKKPGNRGLVQHDLDMNVWDWTQGVGLYGLEKLQDYYGDHRYDTFLNEWFQERIREGLPCANINTTAPYLVLQTLSERLQKEEYKRLCRERAEWLMDGLPKTKENGFQHVVTADKNHVTLNPQQIWADTLFMAALFLAREGKREGQAEWSREAVHQILLHIKYLYDKKTGLLFHGWSFERMDNFGAVHWARGNAWFSYGILELLESLEGMVDGGTGAFMLDTYAAQMEALQKLQAEDGLWHTILDDPDSYEEVSASAGFCAAMYKGMRIGYLGEGFLSCAERALEGIAENIDPEGTVKNVSVGTAMGLDAEHYKNIALAPISYGQSMTALAFVEAMEFYKSRRTEK